MTDKTKTKGELVVELRRRIAELEASEAERKRAEELLAGQREILEMVATGYTIQETLDAITTMIEGLAPGTLCSILLLDEAGQHLSHGSAPSLPKEYMQAVDGLAIGPCAGSCGTAAYRVETVIVEDTELDPLWVDYRDLARMYGLRACWSVPIRDSSGRVLGTFALYDHQPRRPSDQDVRLVETAAHLAGIALERSRAEAALQFAQFAIDRAGDAAFWLDSQARFFYVNDAACRSLGYSREEFLSMTVHDIDSWFPAVTWEEHWREIKQRRSLTFESCHRTKDGRIFPVEINANYLDFNGKEYHCTFARDITERKRAEGELTEARARLQYRLASSSAIIYTTKASGDFECTFVSENLHPIMEHTPRAMLDDPRFWVTHLHPQDAPRVLADVSRLIALGGGTLEYRFRHREGHYCWIQDTFRVMYDEAGRPLEIVGSWADITERKRAEEALRDSEARYRALYDDNPSMYFTVHPQGTVLSVNQFGAEQLGYTVDDLVGQSVLQVVYDEDRKAVVQQLAACVRNPAQVAHWEFRKVGKDGRILWVKETVRAVQGADGNTVVLIVCEDITERRQAEEALEWLRRQNELILTSAGQGIFGLDKKGKTTFVNPAAARMIGWEIEELVGRPMHALLHHSKPDGTPYPEVECPIYAALKDGAVHRMDTEVFWRKDGTSFAVEYISTPIREHGELVGAAVTFKDITVERQTERLAMLGRVAARVAHELNNALSVVLASAQLLLKQTDPQSEAYPDLERIEKYAQTCGRITQDLRRLGRPLPLRRELVEVYPLIEETLKPLELDLTSRKVQVHVVVAPELPPLPADPRLIGQALLNLITNAAEAMPEGGVLTLAARMRQREFMEIAVSDTGVGIAREHLGRIFEPFFTIKPSGEGMGLGLTITSRIAQDHGGRLEVKSELGRGSTFRILLPLVEVPATS